MKGFKFSRMMFLSLVVVSLLGLSGVAMARGGMGGCGGGMGYGNGATLSAEQQAKAQKITSEHFTATNDLRMQMQAKHAELNALMYSQNPDSAKIEALSKEIGALKGKLMSSRAQMQAQLTKEGIPMMGGHRGMGGGMGGGHRGMGGGHRGMGGFDCYGQGAAPQAPGN